MSQSVVRCSSTTRNFQSELRRHRRNDADKISLRFDTHANTTQQTARSRSQGKERATVAASCEHGNSRKGHLQIDPAVMETAAPCFACAHAPRLHPTTKPARRRRGP